MKTSLHLMFFVYISFFALANLSFAEEASSKKEELSATETLRFDRQKLWFYSSKAAKTPDPKVDFLVNQLKEIYFRIFPISKFDEKTMTIKERDINRLSSIVNENQEAFDSERGKFLLRTFYSSKEFEKTIRKTIKNYANHQLEKSRFKDYLKILVLSGIAGLSAESLRYFDVFSFVQTDAGDPLIVALIVGFAIQFYHRFKVKQSIMADKEKETRKVIADEKANLNLNDLSDSCQSVFSGKAKN